MRTEGAVDGLPVVVLIDRELVGHVDPFEHEHVAFAFDFADRLTGEPPVLGVDASGLQRTAEGPGQSPAGSCDEVVQRG